MKKEAQDILDNKSELMKNLNIDWTIENTLITLIIDSLLIKCYNLGYTEGLNKK